MEPAPPQLYDNLTGLPNRQCLQDRLRVAVNQARRYKTRFAVFALGLDGFNSINDNLSYGHGDELLKQVALRCRGAIRESDTIARLGGDEFVIIFHQLHQIKNVNVIAQNCLNIFEEPFVIEGQKIYINASIGIACYPEDGACDESLLKGAFKALANAKAHGKNHFEIYNTHMSEDNVNYLMLSNDLHRALKADEFVLYYQPIIDTQTNTVTAVEALIRWQHPTLGLVGPNDFIHIAEKQGMIMHISDWVMHHACMQLKEWQQKYDFTLKVTVNISAQLFEDTAFTDKVTAILNETKIQPANLCIEITESTIMHHPESAIKTLQALNALGVSLAVDDFGTGYSSLSYLKNFPVDVLKIDRAFVSELESDPVNLTIIRSILMLAEGLKMQAVVEGVETPIQKALLIENGARYFQGFLFSRPIPPKECEQFIRAFHTQE